MPGYKRRYRRKRKRRGNYRRKKKRTLASKVKAIQKRVYENINECWKDNTVTMSASAGGTVFPDFCALSNISQGTDPDQRIGNKITLKKIQMKGLVQVAIGDIYNEIRMIIFSTTDATGNGNTPSVSEILQPGGPGAVADMYSFYRKQSPIKFKILYDTVFKLSNALQNVGTVTPTVLNGCPYPDFIHWEKTIHFKNGQEIWYRGIANGLPTRGAVHMLLISNSTNAIPTGHPQIAFRSRITYMP